MTDFFTRNGYDAREDYVSIHLKWIMDHKNFLPKEQSWLKGDETYLDIMKETYSINIKSPHRNTYAFKTYILDKAWELHVSKVNARIAKIANGLEPTPNGMWFVTIGFNHDTWTIADCDKCIRKILEMEWIISGKANFELYRTNGEHPHVHFILETKEPKSRILDKIFRPLYVKKVVFSKNFIDVKPMMDYHHKYINLDKVSEKMECVERDIIWRKKNNIPDYEKKWSSTIIKEELINQIKYGH